MPIPAESPDLKKHMIAFTAFLNKQGWKYETVLHVIVSFLFHGSRSHRAKTIEWLSELLRDLHSRGDA